MSYEAGGSVLTVFEEHAHQPAGADVPDGPIRAALRPTIPHRFLAEDDAVTGHPTWDIAFVPDTGLIYNGAFAPRRTA